jgi:hypothetical protein
MPAVTTDLPPPVNHIFVDFENVHEIDISVIGTRAVSFTLLVGPRQTKLDVSLVEKLFEHALSVQLVRLASAGRNALDFTLAYYLGRAVAADPAGFFHIVSGDAGYDPLIQHLRSRHISAERHISFATLTFGDLAKPPASAPPAAARKPKPQIEPKSEPASLNEWVARVLKHFRKPSATRPRSQKTLVRLRPSPNISSDKPRRKNLSLISNDLRIVVPEFWRSPHISRFQSLHSVVGERCAWRILETFPRCFLRITIDGSAFYRLRC